MMDFTRLLARALTLLLAAGATYSCSPYQVQADRFGVELASPLPVVVIAEPFIGYEHTPAEEYLRTLALIDALGGNDDLAVVAPWEIDLEPGETWPQGRAVATASMADQGIDPERAIILRVELQHNATTRVVVPTNGMMDGPTAAYQADAELRLIAQDGRGGEELARVEIAFEDDPFVASDDPSDTHPRFTEALDRAGRRLRIELDALYAGGAREGIPTIGVAYGATDLFSYGAGGPPLTDEFATLDGLDAMASRLVWHRQVSPGLDPAVARQFDALPPALHVTEVSGAAGAAGIQPGDFVVRVDGRAARGPQVWTRAFARPEPRRDVPVELVRGGETLTIFVPSGR